VSKSVENWIQGLGTRVSIIIRKYISHMRSTDYLAVPFITFYHSYFYILFHCIYICTFCMLLFNFVKYVFLLQCMLRSVCSVSVPLWFDTQKVEQVCSYNL